MRPPAVGDAPAWLAATCLHAGPTRAQKNSDPKMGLLHFGVERESPYQQPGRRG